MVMHKEGQASRYTLENRMVLGDPGLRLLPPVAPPAVIPAHVELSGNVVTVVAPSDWHFEPTHPSQLKEWNYSEPDLFVPVGSGCIPKCGWGLGGVQNCDGEVPYFTVSVSVPSLPTSVRLVSATEELDGQQVVASAPQTTVADMSAGYAEGDYECTGYAGTPNQNDWHFVTIREQGDGSLNWSNRAGVSWVLLPDGADQFVPAAGAPYPELVYNLVRDSGGQVTGIMKGGDAHGRVGANNVVPDDNWDRFMQRWWPNADHFVHRHDDGALKLLWRIKMLEYDEKTGHIHAQVKSASFVVELPEGVTLQDHALQVDLQRVQQRFATSQLQA